MDFLTRTQLVREKPKNQHRLFYIEAMMKERKVGQKQKEEGRDWETEAERVGVMYTKLANINKM